ncbi:hypothetical protein CLV92_111125 [Kineococcus xinjiangensis]|uniref:Uncharacterized protein n=1 Tax=Kineococcus xinjiangensis TaxID=512762 RepID=A0A2S6IG67_9ACTN|nr:hypothetical protein [Kineococcus xinjiangensis]PPK93208.1 hypothetical protein CLV92_111125 [Kineococcus xinjiangensis]
MTTAHTLARHPLLAVTADPRSNHGTVRPARQPAQRPARSSGIRQAVELSSLSVVGAVPGLALVALLVLEWAGAA